MRVMLKGIHKVRKRLASGEVKTYYYAYRGGPQIKAEPRTPEFIRQYTEAHASIRQPASHTVMALIAAFKASSDYMNLAPSTLKAYASYIKLIELKYGDLPLAAFADQRIRGEFKTWRDTFAATPRKADYLWSTLARILSFAKDRGLIANNPCEGGGRLYVAERTEKVWTEDDVARVLSLAPPSMTLALLLALWTGQRQGDLLRLSWSSYDGSHIRLQQAKTKRRVVIPVGEPLKLALNIAERMGPLVLTNSANRPWTSDGFRSSWRKLVINSGVEGLTFHDLRGSAVVRLALADAPVPQIATFTGHSLKDVEAILDAHYLGRDIGLADIAMARLEKRTKL